MGIFNFLGLGSNDSEKIFEKGGLHLSKGEAKEALICFNEAISLNPNIALYYHDKGVALKLLGNANEALSNFEKAIALNPKMGLAYYSMGSIFFDSNRYDEAVKYFTQAIELKSDSIWEVYYMRANSYYYKSQSHRWGHSPLDKLNYPEFMNNALKDVIKAIELRPQKSVDYFFLRGILYFDMGYKQEAYLDLTFAKNNGDEEAKNILNNYF